MRLTAKDIIVLVILAIFLIFSQSVDTTKKEIYSEVATESDTILDDTVTKNQESVTVRSVIDGDTLKIDYKGKVETVRLLLIDSPESVHPSKPVQPFGVDASKYLKSLLKENSTVKIEFGEVARDKYDRLLAYIWINDIFVNERMVEFGYARVAYINPPNIKYLDQLLTAQEKAQNQKTGIWSIEGYVTDEGYTERK